MDALAIGACLVFATLWNTHRQVQVLAVYITHEASRRHLTRTVSTTQTHLAYLRNTSSSPLAFLFRSLLFSLSCPIHTGCGSNCVTDFRYLAPFGLTDYGGYNDAMDFAPIRYGTFSCLSERPEFADLAQLASESQYVMNESCFFFFFFFNFCPLHSLFIGSVLREMRHVRLKVCRSRRSVCRFRRLWQHALETGRSGLFGHLSMFRVYVAVVLRSVVRFNALAFSAQFVAMCDPATLANCDRVFSVFARKLLGRAVPDSRPLLHEQLFSRQLLTDWCPGRLWWNQMVSLRGSWVAVCVRVRKWEVANPRACCGCIYVCGGDSSFHWKCANDTRYIGSFKCPDPVEFCQNEDITGIKYAENNETLEWAFWAVLIGIVLILLIVFCCCKKARRDAVAKLKLLLNFDVDECKRQREAQNKVNACIVFVWQSCPLSLRVVYRRGRSVRLTICLSPKCFLVARRQRQQEGSALARRARAA